MQTHGRDDTSEPAKSQHVLKKMTAPTLPAISFLAC
jgi:hypothetical protein